jgi:hypothetical protein
MKESFFYGLQFLTSALLGVLIWENCFWTLSCLLKTLFVFTIILILIDYIVNRYDER